jgi:AcrR family transcriptional regulator
MSGILSPIQPLQQASDSTSKPGNPLRQDSRTMLLDAAERLFAQNGIEGVSLREIAVEAGQRNNSAVHYHFGDKQGLIDALLADRFGKVDKLRQGMIDSAGSLADYEPAALLHMMWQPLIDIDADRDGHWLIRFQLACHLQNADSSHPLGKDPESYPASGQIMDVLRHKFEHLQLDQFHYRLGLMALMLWSAVCWHDKLAISTNQRWSSRFSLDETIKMTAAALAAPC